MEQVARDALDLAKTSVAATAEVRAELADLQSAMAAVLSSQAKASSGPSADRWEKWTAIGTILSVPLVAGGLYLTSKANNSTQEATNAQLKLTQQQQTAQRLVMRSAS